MNSIDKRIQLAYSIYFAMTRNMRLRFNSAFSTGYGVVHSLEHIEMGDFLKITKNKSLRDDLIRLKRMTFTVVKP